jgi:hypothetical protein
MTQYTLKFDLPIRSYLKKYIAASKEIDPFHIVNKRCHFSALILEPLGKDEAVCKELDKVRLNDVLPCIYHSHQLAQKKLNLSHEGILLIDFRLKEMFDQQLIDFININHSDEYSIQDSIQKFLNYYQITEDDLANDTAVKMYYRARYPEKSISKKRTKEVIEAQHRLFD